MTTYWLGHIVYDDSTVGIAVVHGGERLVALLASGVPDLKLDDRVGIEADGLREESSADGGLAVVVELVFDEAHDERALAHGGLAEENELVLIRLGRRHGVGCVG